MTSDLVPALVFLPLLAVLAALALPARAGRLLSLVTTSSIPVLLYPLTEYVSAHGAATYALGDLAPPLGIRLHVDGLSLLLLWLVALVMLGTTVHACTTIGARHSTKRFWPTWLALFAGLNALLVSGDLFNLYVGLELLTLSAVALIAYGGSTTAWRAALRYLLLAMLGSLLYLLGVALVYAATGTLDLDQVQARWSEGEASDASPSAPLILMTGGLLVKSAVFPLHGWLPSAHASAPGPVSAVLSALVVKASIYVLYRLWFETLPSIPHAPAGTVLAAMGAGAVLYGSIMALRQQHLKRLVAYSTVAQLGYLMLPFDLPSDVAWQAAVSQMLTHGIAKAAMFLAAANLMRGLGSDELNRLPGADQLMPVSVFAFGLAGVSLMGLPPSGGFLAKWQLLEAAWQLGAWHWVIVVLLGSLLAAAYLFRVLNIIYTRPALELDGSIDAAPGLGAGLSALVLGLLAIVAGFALAPALELLSVPQSMTGVQP